ncbi:Dethiobiotin synthetase [Liberibacter crescens BT-1]|uniref:ATP-dependent dethiobiotin synthetase BioD n=1 Tax=Liberibacter crescens (strain BT-1) TaxID=1215343 RepID=L0EXC4_LIBCB|nr:dethiobiotin synthase [Liberibacter crescens]AGA65318.1 Dethiobiotin synthetase [Liberibacter crescens BT-1]AMC13247.1 ATP-dependent dethiobiotin synthetase BioD [Liberibacter crescens]
MSLRLVITGTDTDVGKTVFSAALANALDSYYWKPIQAGLDSETDSETVHRLGKIPLKRILPEAWRLKTPAAPYISAIIDGLTINPQTLQPPEGKFPLIIEGAGGLLVPITRHKLFIDVFSQWQCPVILCTRTSLGTINHTLLSIEAMRTRKIKILGVVFIGDEQPETEKTISEIGSVHHLGRLPKISPLTPDTLHKNFHKHFDVSSFTKDST